MSDIIKPIPVADYRNEALHGTFLVTDLFNTALVEHPALDLFPQEARDKIISIADDLGVLYQMFGNWEP